MSGTVKYQDDYVHIAAAACALGATDAEVADMLKVSRRCLATWRNDKPEFAEAMSVAKNQADTRIERSLYQKASGYDNTEEQAIKVKNADGSETVEVVEVRKHIPPDTTAQIFWLKNRKRMEWADRKAIDLTATHTLEVRKTIDPSLLSPEERVLLRQVITKALPAPDDEDGEFEEIA